MHSSVVQQMVYIVSVLIHKRNSIVAISNSLIIVPSFLIPDI